jgi:uncharacterized protein
MARTCPICGQPTAAAYRPFCSRRCADVDLQRWLVGRYAIPDRGEAEADDEAGGSANVGATGPDRAED